jgi:putative ABC transport system permease protein
VGRQVKLSGRSGTVEIVGVVPGLRNDMTEKAPQGHVYVPFGQDYRAMVNLILRLKPMAPPAEAAMVRTVRDTIRNFDANLPLISVQTMRHFHEEGFLLWFVRTAARLFAIFGGLALLLAVIGVYGVNAYVVARRTREIGIRMALGASIGNVVWGVLRQGIALAAIGIGIGLVLALAVGFLLRSVIYESSAVDPVAFTVGPLCPALAAGLATYLPARRAARVEPMSALRFE